MMTAPDYRHHILCPVCGITTAITDTQIYVACKDRTTAEDIACQLAKILSKRKGRDLSEEEIIMLRQRYEAWERHSGWS